MKKYTSKEEVHNLAKKIEGIPFKDLAKKYNFDLKNNKNSVGDLFEAYFEKPKDSASEPDLGVVELKATPYKELKRGDKYSAKERLVLNIINYDELLKEDFEHSHFLHKNSVIELAFYQYFKDKPKEDWNFSNVVLYEMKKDSNDFAIIKHDWEVIYDYVNKGNADKLSESLTNYLAACTKGKNKNSTRKQPHSDKPAKQRAFSLKQKFMTHILRDYVLGDKPTEAIIKDPIELQSKGLRSIIKEKFEPYIDMTTEGIAKRVGINTNGKQIPKGFNNILVRRMLGLASGNSLENIDEIEKGSFIMKTIQFDKNGRNKESMSFPKFDYKDLVSQIWVDDDGEPSADLNVMFRESTFIFLVFQYNEEGKDIFKGVKFYRIPLEEINGPIKQVWEETKQCLSKGLKLTYSKNRIYNNLPGKSEGKIIHVRPHSRQSSYIDNAFSSELPTPASWTNPNDLDTVKYPKTVKYMTSSCFWLNNDYIKKVVVDLLN